MKLIFSVNYLILLFSDLFYIYCNFCVYTNVMNSFKVGVNYRRDFITNSYMSNQATWRDAWLWTTFPRGTDLEKAFRQYCRVEGFRVFVSFCFTLHIFLFLHKILWHTLLQDFPLVVFLSLLTVRVFEMSCDGDQASALYQGSDENDIVPVAEEDREFDIRALHKRTWGEITTRRNSGERRGERPVWRRRSRFLKTPNKSLDTELVSAL